MKTIAVVIVAILVCSYGLAAQNADRNKQIESLASLPTSNAEYKLGPGDLIEIRVFGVKDFDQSQRVSARGTITLPLINEIFNSASFGSFPFTGKEYCLKYSQATDFACARYGAK